MGGILRAERIGSTTTGLDEFQVWKVEGSGIAWLGYPKRGGVKSTQMGLLVKLYSSPSPPPPELYCYCN